jgi:raffinose/stachyose/melibiose transport system permease protein
MNIFRTKSYYSLWFLVPTSLLFLVFFIIPNVMGFVLAFTDWSILRFDKISFIGLDNFKMLLETSFLRTAIFNTFYFTIVTAILKNILGFILALIANREFRLKNYVRTVFFAPCIVSSMVTGIVFGAIYNPEFGLLNKFLNEAGLGFMAKEWLVDKDFAMLAVCGMEIWHWVGFSMVIYLAGLQNIPKYYYDASKIDGANSIQRLKNIVVPLIMPSVTVSIMLSLISGLKVFDQVFSLTNGGPMNKTQVISTLIYKNFSNGLLGYSAAMGLVFTIIVISITFTILRITRKMEVEM